MGSTCVSHQSLQSCLTLCDTMDCSPPGPSVLGILQARILERVTIPSTRGSSRPGIKPTSPAAPALQVDPLPLGSRMMGRLGFKSRHPSSEPPPCFMKMEIRNVTLYRMYMPSVCVHIYPLYIFCPVLHGFKAITKRNLQLYAYHFQNPQFICRCWTDSICNVLTVCLRSKTITSWEQVPDVSCPSLFPRTQWRQQNRTSLNELLLKEGRIEQAEE